MPPSEKPLYLELTKHTLLVTRAAGATIEIFRECALDNKPAVEETLAAFDPDWKTNGLTAVAALAPLPVWWHLSSSEEAARHRQESALREFGSSLSHGLAGPLELTCCHAADGTPISSQGSAPWLLGLSTAEGLASTNATATTWKIAPARSESSTLSHVGGIVTSLRFAGSGAVILWELAVERSQLFLLTPRGVEAVVPCAAGLDAIFGGVQAAIGLKFRAAAARLFFNETYDFSEIGAQAAIPVAAALKEARAKLPANSQNATLACTSLTGKQSWFVREAALAAGLQPWAPDLRLLAAQLKLQFSDNSIEAGLTPSALGLLHLVAGQAHRSTAWHPVWTQAGTVPLASSTPLPLVAPPAPAVVAPVPAVIAVAPKTVSPAPVVAVPPVVPTPAPKAVAVPSAPPVPKPAAPAPKPGAAAIVPPPPAPAPVPVPVPIPAAVVKPAPAATPVPVPTAKAVPTEKPAPVSVAAKSATPVAVKTQPASKSQSSHQKSGKSAQAAAAAKNNAVKTTAAVVAAPASVPAPSLHAVKALATTAPSPLIYPAPGASRSAGKNGKSRMGLYLGIAAAAVIVAIAGFMWKSAEDAKAVKIAADQAAIAEKIRVETERAKALAEIDAKAKAEAARIQREIASATQAREVAANQQRAQQQEAERIAKSPGTVVVATAPSSASVSIDGGQLQKSPFTLNEISPGSHRLRVTLPGHEPVEVPFEIKGTQTTDLGVIQLERTYGTIAITSQPEGAEFSARPVFNVLGAPARTGRTPATLEDIEPGEYLVTFSHAPWKEQTQTITVAKRALAKATAAFTDSLIRFTSVPTGAIVSRNGTVLGTTPFTLQEPAGPKASYIFGFSGYEELTVAGETTQGQILDLNGNLRRVDRLALVGEVKQQPKALEQPGPKLSVEQRRLTADIVIAVTIGRDAKLRDLAVTKSNNKEIAQLCVEALGKWKFQPALGLDDQPVSVRVSIPFRIGAN